LLSLRNTSNRKMSSRTRRKEIEMITVNGNRSEWEEGLTVEKLLARENYTFRMISVWIDDRPVEKKEYSTKLIPDGAKVQVIHNISGG